MGLTLLHRERDVINIISITLLLHHTRARVGVENVNIVVVASINKCYIVSTVRDRRSSNSSAPAIKLESCFLRAIGSIPSETDRRAPNLSSCSKVSAL